MAVVHDELDTERIDMRTTASNQVGHGIAYVHALPLVRGRRVADLCCGTGYGTRLLSEAASFVTGYDYSSTAIDYNNKRLLPNTAFELADVEKLGKLDVDVITCMQGLEHLNQPRAIIRENLDKMWIFALPNDTGSDNEFHHHKITLELIKGWFGDSVFIRYFDDNGNLYSSEPDWFTNYLGVYRG